MSELVAIGEQILAAEQARIERANIEAQAMAELRVNAPTILDLLAAISARLGVLETAAISARIAVLEARVAENTRMTMATRIRRPVRDRNGVIQYVVDEISPPPEVAALAEDG